MTEGDRICPYCIKPMKYVWSIGNNSIGITNGWRCEACRISVTIAEEPVQQVKIKTPLYEGNDEAQSDSCWPDD